MNGLTISECEVTGTGSWTNDMTVGLSINASSSSNSGTCTMQASSSNNDDPEFGKLLITATGFEEASVVFPSYTLIRNGEECSSGDLIWGGPKTLELEAKTTGISYILKTPKFKVGTTTYIPNKTTQDVLIRSNMATEVTIKYTAREDDGEQSEIFPQFGAYWAGWTGETHKLYEKYVDLDLTTIYLSFADFVNDKIDTSVSGHLTDIPTEGS